MQCVDAKNQIALLVGDDLDAASRPAVEEHLSACKSCRQYQQSMQEAQGQLELLREVAPATSESESLWPAIRSEIETVNAGPAAPKSNRLVAALAIAATLVAGVWISKDLMVPTQYDDSNGNGAMASPVNYPSSNVPRPVEKRDRDSNDEQNESRPDVRR